MQVFPKDCQYVYHATQIEKADSIWRDGIKGGGDGKSNREQVYASSVDLRLPENWKSKQWVAPQHEMSVNGSASAFPASEGVEGCLRDLAKERRVSLGLPWRVTTREPSVV